VARPKSDFVSTVLMGVRHMATTIDNNPRRRKRKRAAAAAALTSAEGAP
jgi:hypothetical protein